jgi:uracil-DNA glycosylase
VEPTAAAHPVFDPYPPELATCRRCPRLAAHREEVARVKRRAYAGERYWGAPVPGFGDPAATLLIVGLAPGAHGSNRTGRMFTGDASGDFLYPALHRAGLADRARSRGRDDGLRLDGVWITAVGRCAPPGNKPTPAELDACRPWFAHDVDGLPGVRAVLALGRIAHDGVLRLWRERGLGTTLGAHPFAHGAVHRLAGLPGAAAAGVVPLVDSFHVSRQNTNTGRLTAAMFDEALATAMRLAGEDPRPRAATAP